jgi:membrane protein YdbS with pleckstrin-like domain
VSDARRSGSSESEGATSEQTPTGVDAEGGTDDTEVILDVFGRPYQRAAPFPVEKSGDPLGGHPIDEPMRFWWSRRRRRPSSDFEIPTARNDDPAPVSHSFIRDRFGGVRSRYFPLPDEVVHTYLGSGEVVLHQDHPSFRYFVVDKILFFLAVGAAGVLVVVSLAEGWTLAAKILIAIMLAIVVFLFCKRMGDRYTSYVITNARMIRMAGIVSRKIESIPWVRVTDVGFEQSALERILGYATLNIESANETMGLRRMRGVADPVAFNHHLMDMVVAKQGPAAPLGRRSEYRILKSDKGLFGKRRGKGGGQPRTRLVLDDSSPQAGTEAPAEDRTEVIPGSGATPGPAGPVVGPGDSSDI